MEKLELGTFLSIFGLYIAYFVGITIRRVVLPGKNSPPLTHQLILGIPVALVIVTPFAFVLEATRDLGTYVVTLGIAMEHGMIVTETAVQRLGSLRAELQLAPANGVVPRKKVRKAANRTVQDAIKTPVSQ